MNTVLKLEEAAQMLLALMILSRLQLGWPWWVFLLLFFAPDLSMIGYLAGPKAGGILYNLAHHKGIAAAVLLAGFLWHHPTVQAAGLLLWAHSSYDRVLGYGLKYLDSFAHTHLGMIGKG